MSIRRILQTLSLALLLGLVPASELAALSLGDSIDSVQKEFGKPLSKSRMGEREIWSYASGLKVTFFGGKVERFRGNLPPPLPIAETTVQASPPAEPQPVPPKEAAAPSELEEAPRGPSRADIAHVQLEKFVEQLDAESNRAAAAEPESPLKWWAIGLGCAISLVCRLLLMAKAAQVSRGLAMAVSIVPLGELAYAIPYWDEARIPTLISLGVGFPLILIGHTLL